MEKTFPGFFYIQFFLFTSKLQVCEKKKLKFLRHYFIYLSTPNFLFIQWQEEKLTPTSESENSTTDVKEKPLASDLKTQVEKYRTQTIQKYKKKQNLYFKPFQVKSRESKGS